MQNESAIVLNKVQNTLIATMQTVLTDDVLAQFQQQLLSKIEEVKVEYILCDLSGMELMDAEEYQAITNTFKMASIMGVKTIFVGLSPGVAAMVVDYEIDTSCFKYALNIEDGLQLAQSS